MIRSISSMSSTMPSFICASCDAHLDAEAQARERRAQVVRHAGEQQRAVVLELPQVGDHRVEAAIERRDLRRPVLRQRRRRFAAADALDGGVELAQRAREIAREHERGERAARSPARGSRSARAWDVVGARPRRQRKADPVAGAAGFDAHEQQLQPRRDAQLGARGRGFRAAALRAPASAGPSAGPPTIGRSASGTMRTPYSRPMSRSVSRRSCVSAASSAARSACSCTILVSLNWRASSAARSWRKNRIVAASAIATTAISSRVSRPNSERGQSVTRAAAVAARGRRCRRRVVVGNEHVAEAPDGLDVARIRGIGLDQLAQPRHLHVDRAVEHLVIAAAREQHQLFARERLARMLRRTP